MIDLANRIKEFETKFSYSGNISFPIIKDEYEDFRNEKNKYFVREIRGEAFEILCEIVSRHQPILRRSLSSDMRCGIDSIVHSNLVGPDPLQGCINFFNESLNALEDNH